MLEMIAENSGAPRRRSGRNAIQSSATLSRPATRLAHSSATMNGACSQRDRIQADERAPHEHGAVRQVQNMMHAEDQREAEGEQRIDAADHERVQELLCDHAALVAVRHAVGFDSMRPVRQLRTTRRSCQSDHYRIIVLQSARSFRNVK